jgi:pimeloyl-ACP methyl ester carboxylesterase
MTTRTRHDPNAATATKRTPSVRLALSILALLALAPLSACLGPPSSDNRLFPVSESLAESERRRMRAAPVAFERPLIVLAGYRTGLHQPEGLRRRLATLVAGDDAEAMTMALSYEDLGDIPAAARRVVRTVDRMFPSDDPDRTIEVDIVGVSMGGLVARYAALEVPDRAERAGEPPTRRLRIRRLFTIATPHRGARAADVIAPDQAARDMRAGSTLLQRLDEGLRNADYELIAYARTRDAIVGEENTAPPGVNPIWVSGPDLLSHATASRDWSITIDIARRLRGEWPLGFAGSSLPAN